MTTEHDSLRKAAVLVSSLSPDEADRLLEHMPEEYAARVRRAVMDLEDVSEQEQADVIAAFMGQSPAQPTPEDDDVALEVSPAARHRLEHAPLAGTPVNHEGSGDSAVRFQFLQSAPLEVMLKFVRHEHPQTIAVVLAHLPPDSAGKLIVQLDAVLQLEVLTRVAHLNEMDPAVLEDLEKTLHSLMANDLQLWEKRSAGMQAVESILSTVADSHRQALLQALAVHRQPLDQNLDATAAASAARAPTFESTQDTADQTSEATLPAIEFDDLESMQGEHLAKVLQAAGPELMLLALAGARQQFVRKLMSLIPARYARVLQRRIEQLGPTRLDDLAIAQRKVARMAAQLVAQGEIPAPQHKRFAVAV